MHLAHRGTAHKDSPGALLEMLSGFLPLHHLQLKCEDQEVDGREVILSEHRRQYHPIKEVK